VQLLWLAVLAPAVLLAARERGVVGVAVAELVVVAVVVVPCYLLMLRGCGLRIAPLGAAVVVPLLVAAVGAGAAALVARELSSPLLATLAGGLICLVAIGCVLALRPDQLRQLRDLRSGTAVADPPTSPQDPVVEAAQA
jgi:PST family polysaccharide transporter